MLRVSYELGNNIGIGRLAFNRISDTGNIVNSIINDSNCLDKMYLGSYLREDNACTIVYADVNNSSIVSTKDLIINRDEPTLYALSYRHTENTMHSVGELVECKLNNVYGISIPTPGISFAVDSKNLHMNVLVYHSATSNELSGKSNYNASYQTSVDFDSMADGKPMNSTDLSGVNSFDVF